MTMKKIISSLFAGVLIFTFTLPVQTDAASIDGGPFTYDFYNYVVSQDYYTSVVNPHISWTSTSCQPGDKIRVTLYHQNGTPIASFWGDECGDDIWFDVGSTGYYYFKMENDEYIYGGTRNHVVGSGFFHG